MTTFYNKVLNDEERARLVSNIAGHLKDAKDFIQKRAVSFTSSCDYCYIEQNVQGMYICGWHSGWSVCFLLAL